MKVANSLKPFSFNYSFARDGGAVGVIPLGVNFLANRYAFSCIIYTKSGLTGGAGTTISMGTAIDPLLLINNVPIATFIPNFGINTNFLGFVGFSTLTKEEIIFTIGIDPVTSGNLSVLIISAEFTGA